MLPGFEGPFSLELPPDIAALRHKALRLQQATSHEIVEIPIIDAQSWQAHTAEEDWLVWRARRCAGRLCRVPLDLEAGECIVGKPSFRVPTDEQKQRIGEARAILASMPPFPGGDSGHLHPDYDKLFRSGIRGVLEEIGDRQQAPGLDAGQHSFYEACRVAMEGLAVYIRRTADECESMAEQDRTSAASWRELAGICRHVAEAPPATFHQAIQLMFFALVALWFGEDHGLTTPGRMDQTLRSFYEADLAAGRITPRSAFELICCLYIHLNRVLWPGRAESVLVGGRDRDGRDATNDLTYLCLAARLATRLVYPTVAVAWHAGTPADLMDFGVRMLATGIGDPAFFNDELIVEGLREHGVDEADSYDYMNSTCVEIKLCGASNVWVTQPYINVALPLLDVMDRVAAGELAAPATFGALARKVREGLTDAIRCAAKEKNRIWNERARWGGFPLASCLTRDCLERGRDFDRGGARYNWVENSFVGLANLVDSLVAVKRLVYEEGALSLAEFHRILRDDFAGHENLRMRIVNELPKYGNDHAEADTLAHGWAEFLIASTESHTVGPHRYVPGFFCWVMHEELGSQTGATPDGRRAGLPLADGAGAAQGRERRGPTASVLSTTKWCHRQALGGVVHNAKFSKTLLKTKADRQALRDMIETYLKRGGFEIQINVLGQEDLLRAQERPEEYPHLLVRVAGYSDYFTHLNRKMQDEIIARTEFDHV